MSIVLPWATGFEAGSANVLSYPYGVTTSSPTPRTGSYCGHNYSITNCGVNLASAVSEVWFGGAFYIGLANDRRPFRWFSSSTEMGSVRKNSSTGKLEAYVGTSLVATSASAFPDNSWGSIVVHLKIDDATGVLQVYVDGNLWIDYSGDTKPGSATTINNIYYGYCSAVTSYFDDMWVATTNLGYDIRITGLIPTADGDVEEWDCSAGADMYAMVDEKPHDSDTTYLQSDTTGQKFLVGTEDFSTSTAVIVGVNVLLCAKANSGLSGDGLRVLCKTAGSEYTGDDESITLTYTYYNKLWLLSPATSAPWTDAAIDALQVGAEDRS